MAQNWNLKETKPKCITCPNFKILYICKHDFDPLNFLATCIYTLSKCKHDLDPLNFQGFFKNLLVVCKSERNLNSVESALGIFRLIL